MMNSMFRNTSKGAEERREAGWKGEVLHSKSSCDLSLAGDGFFKKDPAPDPRLSGRHEGGGGRAKPSLLLCHLMWGF